MAIEPSNPSPSKKTGEDPTMTSEDRQQDLSTSRRDTGRARRDLFGQSMTWLCGGALALNVLLVAAILGVLVVNGLAYFWQTPLSELDLADDRVLLGEIWDREEVPRAEGSTEAATHRIRIKVGNRDIDGVDFVWVDESEIVRRDEPAAAVLFERLEWGNFYGYPIEIKNGDDVLVSGREATWSALAPLLETKEDERHEVEVLEKGAIGRVNAKIEDLRLELRRIELEELPAEQEAQRKAEVDTKLAEFETEYQGFAAELFAKRDLLMAETLVVETADGMTKEFPVGNIVRALQPNELGLTGRLGIYVARIWEFVSDDPRESNTEGGIFPAIFGTVMMVFLMTFAVTPLGLMAAIYLREYAKEGPLVRIVRIAVNNLAGVPSIVFGVFGLGFFVYVLGGSIDQLFYPEALPTPTFGTGGIFWGALTLALLTVPVVIVAAEEGLAAVPRIVREGSLALGATKFETLRRVVVPAAAPGILTGMILAMARAAGEVAPLMIVGMVKLAPALPVDGNFPFVHLERKFMHLGFHIYDVGFQSPNVEATKPLVFATALLLIVIVTLMNLAAIGLRNHLRRKYAGSAV